MIITFGDYEKRIYKRPDPLKVSQWAARHRVLTVGPRKGKWRNEVTPYCIEPMDTWNDPYIREMALCFPPQSGKSQSAINMLMYDIDQRPSSAMYVMPDEKVTKRMMRRQLKPSFVGTPRIASLMSPRLGDTTVYYINFVNGMDLMMAWATSAAELASESVEKIYFDETDKYPDYAGKEPDPIALGEIRTNAFPHTKKILYFSTPTTDEGAILTIMRRQMDEIRYYHALCPYCGELQQMTFESITWPAELKDPRTIRRKKSARYECAKCGMLWDDYLRDVAVKKGKWIAAEPVERPRAVGFYLKGSWYSPFISLSDVAAASIVAEESPKNREIFVTQHKTEGYRDVVTPRDENTVLDGHKTDIPKGVVPEEAVALTLGGDSQKHGYWYIVRAWAPDLTSWLIDYGFIPTWDEFESYAYTVRFPVQNSQRTMGIWRSAVDTGGGKDEIQEISRTEEMYQYLRKVRPNTIYGVKGESKDRLKRISVSVIDKMPSSGKAIPGGLALRLLDVNQFKDLIHFRLDRGVDPETGQPQSQRFYLHAETGADYVKQLLAEQKEWDPRRKKTAWVRKRKANHYLDCEVYAAACADPEWTPSLQMLAAALEKTVPEASAAQPKQPPPSRDERPQRDGAAGISQVRNILDRYRRPGWLNERAN
jgi:phage terminase large subunit GpA-like protein